MHTSVTAPARQSMTHLTDDRFQATWMEIVAELTRRGFLAGGLAACGAALAGCSSTADRHDSQSDQGTIRVKHAYGETVLPKAPERVITLGLSDQDPVLALGVQPIAVAPWYGDFPDHIWPWARAAMGDAKPTVLNDGVRNDDEPPYEELAGLRPDLILSLYNGTTEEQYQRLSSIAPTVVPTAEFLNFTITWQEALRLSGEALGRADQAQELAAALEQRFELAASENPEFADQVAVIAERFNPGETVVRSGAETRAQFFRSLGFTIPDEIAGEKPDAAGEIIVSDELMTELSKDLLIFNVGWDPSIRGVVEKMPLFQQLPVTRAGKVIWIEDPVVSGAFSFGTALSLSYALDALLPELQRVMGRP